MDMKYLYCVTEEFNEMKMTGIGGMPVEKTGYKTICLVYTSVKAAAMYSEENFLRHEDILEELFKRNITIIPFRFGTIVSCEAGHQILEKNFGDFTEYIRKLKGKAEMGVRALWDYEEIYIKATSELKVPEINVSNDKIKKYLDNRMKNHKYEEFIKTYATTEAEKINEKIAGDSESTFTVMKTNSMFFNGAYLIDKTEIPDFYEKFRQTMESFKEYKFIVTGPWPPFNFCSIEI